MMWKIYGFPQVEAWLGTLFVFEVCCCVQGSRLRATSVFREAVFQP